jgi:hypothetical protein
MSPTYTVASDQARRTPPWLYQAVCQLLGVAACELDAFASAENSLCRLYYNEELDGLKGAWLDPTFANPPFKLMTKVVDKALAEAQRGVRSVLIGPVGCSQVWYHKLWPRATVYHPDQRLVYLSSADGSETAGAMADSALYLVDGTLRARPDVQVLPVGVPLWPVQKPCLVRGG